MNVYPFSIISVQFANSFAFFISKWIWIHFLGSHRQHMSFCQSIHFHLQEIHSCQWLHSIFARNDYCQWIHFHLLGNPFHYAKTSPMQTLVNRRNVYCYIDIVKSQLQLVQLSSTVSTATNAAATLLLILSSNVVSILYNEVWRVWSYIPKWSK